MKSNGVTLVCFDLGGVLVRIRGSFSCACQAAGLPVRAGAEEGYCAQGLLLGRFARGELPLAELALQLSDALGDLYTPEELEAVHRAWIVDEYEGVSDLVERLVEGGTTCAVLSNTDASHWDRMIEWPTLGRVPHRFASHLIGAAKPAPEAFRAVERETGRRPEEILFFDDTPDNVEAACALGWQACRVLPCEPPVTQMARVLRAHAILD